MSFQIMTDSSCDLPQSLIEQFGLTVLPLSVTVGSDTYFDEQGKIDIPAFYNRLRAGEMAKTSALNIQSCYEAMHSIVEKGDDVLYIGFSSGLSSTYSSGETAARELQEQFPKRKVLAVDSLCASMGQGLLVYLCALKQQQGATIEEVAAYAMDTRLKVTHWFTVDDLHHLKRGGRISPATAILGSALQIKPIMNVDNAGKLQPVSKSRGRRGSMRDLVKAVSSQIVDAPSQTLFLSHGDCPEEAAQLAKMLKEALNVQDVIVGHIGPVIGAHSGPGTLAVFSLGNNR